MLNSHMACTDHDVLYQQWDMAQKEDAEAVNSGVSSAISYPRLVEWREAARRALREAEARLNSHILDCEVCQAEGLEAIYDCDQLHE
jgi:hypothetical protein